MGPILFPKLRQEITTTGCVMTRKSVVFVYFEAESWNHARALVLAKWHLLTRIHGVITRSLQYGPCVPWKHQSLAFSFFLFCFVYSCFFLLFIYFKLIKVNYTYVLLIIKISKPIKNYVFWDVQPCSLINLPTCRKKLLFLLFCVGDGIVWSTHELGITYSIKYYNTELPKNHRSTDLFIKIWM